MCGNISVSEKASFCFAQFLDNSYEYKCDVIWTIWGDGKTGCWLINPHQQHCVYCWGALCVWEMHSVLNKQCAGNSGRRHFSSSPCSDDACWLKEVRGRGKTDRRGDGGDNLRAWGWDRAYKYNKCGMKRQIGAVLHAVEVQRFKLFQQIQNWVCAVVPDPSLDPKSQLFKNKSSVIQLNMKHHSNRTLRFYSGDKLLKRKGFYECCSHDRDQHRQRLSESLWYGEIKILTLSKWSGGHFYLPHDPVTNHCCSLSQDEEEDMFN